MRGLRKLTLDKRNKTLREVVRNKKATDTTQVMELIEKGDTLLTRYTCKGSDGTKFFVFAKEVEPKEADILNHEKKVYNICNHLVQMGVCPFRVQGYDVAKVASADVLTWVKYSIFAGLVRPLALLCHYLLDRLLL